MEGSLDALTGRIEERELTQEMRSSYLDYAMSVIVGRALPDVRDGFKPVHRRVLYAMHDLGLQPNRPYRKCAFIVGEVMGKYHPHGDSAIYDTLVRMAQEFSLRYPLVDGQGNFGSIDDDPAAAMRYTEARLARLATEMLRDIDADTVDFGPNYDESQSEPLVLPARFPNLLVNGSSGIAVGMATNIPPHNLSESIGAVKAYLENPEIDLAGLMEHIKGPDFPGGGIMSMEGIRDAYASGRASVKVRGRAHIEPLKGGREAIIVSELPFQVKKGGDGGLITKIADLVREKKINGISDLRDESDRSGMRLVIELKRGGDPAEVVLNQLYKHTQMQNSFGINMVALVDGVPKTLSLKELVEHYVTHQREVVTRRTQHELRRAEARAHVLEGLLIALDNLDAVIELIRASADTDAARDGLMTTFSLSEIQAQAILDMRLSRLTAMESSKVREEHTELIEMIAELRAILGEPARIDALIVEELNEVDARYGDDRRTEITHFAGDMNIEDMIADQQMVISLTNSGYVKRLPLVTYRQQHRGGIGVMGMEMKEGDFIEHLHICSTHDFLLFFTNRGKVYRLKVYELPEGSRTSKGRALINVLPLVDAERVMAVIPTRDFKEAKYLAFATANGLVKKTEFLAYNTPIRADGIIAIKVRDGDELVQVRLTSGDDDLLLVSKSGHASRFSEKKVRSMGRDTSGVKGMNVSGKIGNQPNRVLAMDVARDDSQLFVVTENGYGKRTPVAEYPVKGRGTKGVLTIKMTEQQGRPGRRPDRPRAPGPAVHLPERDGPAHQRRRHLADGPSDAGRQGDEHQGRRPDQRRRAGDRIVGRCRGRRRGGRGRRRGRRRRRAAGERRELTTASGEVLSQRALNRALLERQLLLRRVEMPVPRAVEHLVGLQAQAPMPPYYGLWSRLRGFDPHELGEMLTDREAVRMTLMRGTVHLVTVADALLLRPLVQVVIERSHNGAFGRRMGGADPADLAARGARAPRRRAADRARARPATGRARDRRRRGSDRQRRPRLRPARPGPAARGLGGRRAGEVRDDRVLDRPRAGARAVDRRAGRALPRRLRSGLGDGHAELVRADQAQGRLRSPAARPGELPRRAWHRALRPARGAPPRPRCCGAGALPGRVRQPAARPRRPPPHHPGGLPLGRDARTRAVRQQPARRRDAAGDLVARARRQAPRDARDSALREAEGGRT